MIVRDAGDRWQVVTQPDHADLSGQLARAWGGDGFARPDPYDSVVTAAVRHDDGWAVWERAPALSAESKPITFLDVNVRSHLAFYRACIAAVGEQDPYAGLLVSMHGSGIYNGRYGTQPGLRLKHAPDEKVAVDAFIAEQEASQAEQVRELGVPEKERWVNYKLLQIYDRLSLYFCLNDLDAGKADTLAPVPRGYSGEEVEFWIEPLGPWHVRIDPFPFAESRARFTLLRRLLPKRQWPDAESFREELRALEPERVEIVAES